jgi:hypothetical protein
MVSTSERTRRAESRLGVPRKQNGGERRARLGIHAVKRSRAREKKDRKEELHVIVMKWGPSVGTTRAKISWNDYKTGIAAVVRTLCR